MNGGNNNFQKAFTITVTATDVNEAPTAVTLSPTSRTLPITTSLTSRLLLSTITITDDGMGTNAITFTVSPSDDTSAQFEIFQGDLYLNTLVIGVYTVEVTVTDSSVIPI